MNDKCLSFNLDNNAFRGRILRLDNVITEIFSHRHYPDNVAAALSETTALGIILASLMKFDGIDTQERARELTGCDVYFPRSLADEDETDVSWAELVGYSLIDSNTGKAIGEIAAIDDTTINILFELTDGKLIPASDELIQHIDTKQHQIEINLPEGILEL